MNPGVSDHALVRWLERTGAMDTEAVRAMLSASLARAARAAATMGESDYLILADGLVYVLREHTLVTVLEDDGRHAQIHRRARETPAQ